MADAKANNGKVVTVRLVKGLRGVRQTHRLSVQALGLRRVNQLSTLNDTPQVRGLIRKVDYLVRVEE